MKTLSGKQKQKKSTGGMAQVEGHLPTKDKTWSLKTPVPCVRAHTHTHTHTHKVKKKSLFSERVSKSPWWGC
jgi:hypothetical protein